jgi:hypothetical protein
VVGTDGGVGRATSGEEQPRPENDRGRRADFSHRQIHALRLVDDALQRLGVVGRSVGGHAEGSGVGGLAVGPSAVSREAGASGEAGQRSSVAPRDVEAGRESLEAEGPVVSGKHAAASDCGGR